MSCNQSGGNFTTSSVSCVDINKRGNYTYDTQPRRVDATSSTSPAPPPWWRHPGRIPVSGFRGQMCDTVQGLIGSRTTPKKITSFGSSVLHRSKNEHVGEAWVFKMLVFFSLMFKRFSQEDGRKRNRAVQPVRGTPQTCTFLWWQWINLKQWMIRICHILKISPKKSAKNGIEKKLYSKKSALLFRCTYIQRNRRLHQ